jgi:hypothetical protein
MKQPLYKINNVPLRKGRIDEVYPNYFYHDSPLHCPICKEELVQPGPVYPDVFSNPEKYNSVLLVLGNESWFTIHPKCIEVFKCSPNLQ